MTRSESRLIVLFGSTLGIMGLGSIARGVPRALFDTESAALWTIGLDGGSPAELLTLWRFYDNSATLSTLADEIDSMAPDVNPSIDTDGTARVGDLGAEGKCPNGSRRNRSSFASRADNFPAIAPASGSPSLAG
jgi:hypothetical protein